MRYLLLGVPFIVLIILSILFGCVCYLWRFNEEHFDYGVNFINERVIKFINWFDKHS